MSLTSVPQNVCAVCLCKKISIFNDFFFIFLAYLPKIIVMKICFRYEYKNKNKNKTRSSLLLRKIMWRQRYIRAVGASLKKAIHMLCTFDFCFVFAFRFLIADRQPRHSLMPIGQSSCKAIAPKIFFLLFCFS